MDISPEHVLSLFKTRPRQPVGVRDVLSWLRAPSSDKDRLFRVLRELADEGYLIRLRGKSFMLPKSKDNSPIIPMCWRLR